MLKTDDIINAIQCRELRLEPEPTVASIAADLLSDRLEVRAGVVRCIRDGTVRSERQVLKLTLLGRRSL